MKILQPLADRLIIEELPEPKSKGGILLPAEAKGSPLYGRVLAVGEGVRQNGVLIPISINIDDTILYYRDSGEQIEIDGHSLLVIREGDVLAIVREIV
jgi:chaperonin GroES